jgi:co-chaperonin GroES (HSP10)
MKRIITTISFLVLAAAVLSLPALAQDHKDHQQKAAGGDVIIGNGKKGEVHFATQVKAGDAVLKPGMYQVQHVVEGNDHVIIFKEMDMPAGYKMGNTPVGKEVARIKCKIEPVAKKVGNTRITLRTNAAGEKEIAEVQVAGEAFKHLL